ncbi:FG-GAP and VCBS repeat-containing protein [Nonomuraea sp. NPDC050790]|uniref:FG-GAP and VCBS repeat-containing protein n=1 Tax=Nonomuraea sp. NPDC050790 TaxID=3364371 RepID=UPI0037878F03
MNALLAACLVVPLLSPASAGAAAGCGGRLADFDDDGRADLAVAAPYTGARAGSVSVLYGSGRKATLRQDDPETGDSFGSALAVGDFDGDRCADLAVGVSEEFAGKARPGADGDGVVQVFRGGPDGLVAWRRLALGKPRGDRYGAALAAGDLDGDGDDELAVGAPGLGAGGGVVVHFLKKRGPYQITQQSRWVGQQGRVTDQWGAALTTGDFDGDGRAELVVGAPADSVTTDGQGSATVIDTVRRHATQITQDSPGIKGSSEKWDAFGASLTTGDFNADGRADLAIGAPGEGLSANQRAMDYGDGMVHVVYGSRSGLRTTRSEAWTQRVLNGEPRYYDRFGASLAAGDFNGDGDAELAIGVPGERAVQVLAGTRSGGLTRHGDLLIKGKGRDFGASMTALASTPRYRLLGRSRPVYGLVVAAPGDGVLTLLPGARRPGAFPGLRASKATKLATGSGLFGYAFS